MEVVLRYLVGSIPHYTRPMRWPPVPSVDGLARSGGRSDLIRKSCQTRKCPKEIQGFVPTRAGSKKRPDIGAHLQTMTESLHYGRVTWFNGSGQHFRRFNQMRQPNGAGIGTRQSGTVHTNQRVRYASKACATKILMLNKTPAAATNSIIALPP